MASPDGLNTPTEWCDYYHVEVLDPDGWRKPDSPPWTQPIGLAEFWTRVCSSTARQLDVGAYGRIQHDLRVLAQRQPAPAPNDRPHVADMVIEDIRIRKAHGVAEYGTPLQPFNGRDALRDLYEELLDGVHYLAQAMWERDHPADPDRAAVRSHIEKFRPLADFDPSPQTGSRDSGLIRNLCEGVRVLCADIERLMADHG